MLAKEINTFNNVYLPRKTAVNLNKELKWQAPMIRNWFYLGIREEL